MSATELNLTRRKLDIVTAEYINNHILPLSSWDESNPKIK